MSDDTCVWPVVKDLLENAAQQSISRDALDALARVLDAYGESEYTNPADFVRGRALDRVSGDMLFVGSHNSGISYLGIDFENASSELTNSVDGLLKALEKDVGLSYSLGDNEYFYDAPSQTLGVLVE
jgi:hypothetical protein